MEMLHTKFHQNLMINNDFEIIWEGGNRHFFVHGGDPHIQNSHYFQKVEIIFENQNFQSSLIL